MSISLAALRNEVHGKVNVEDSPPDMVDNVPILPIVPIVPMTTTGYPSTPTSSSISMSGLRAVSLAELKKSKNQPQQQQQEEGEVGGDTIPEIKMKSKSKKQKSKSKHKKISLKELQQQPTASSAASSAGEGSDLPRHNISLSDLKRTFHLTPSESKAPMLSVDEVKHSPGALASLLEQHVLTTAPPPAPAVETPSLHPVSITSNIKKNCEAIQTELEDKEDADFRATHAVYFKMAKLGIPLPNIEQKLLMNQVDPLLMEQILTKLGGATSSVFAKPDLKEATALSRIKLQRLHWKPLDSKHLSASSLWASIAKAPERDPSAESKIQNNNNNKKKTKNKAEPAMEGWNGLLSPEDTDLINKDLTANLDDYELNEVEFFFGIDTSKANRKRTDVSESSKINKLHLPKVLDLQRAMNVAIGLSTFKSISRMRYVLNGVCCLNSMGSRLTPDKLLNLTSMLPTLSEAKALQSTITVNKGEIFCKLAMEYYPHLSGRLSCFLTVISFEEIYQSVIPKLKMFIKSIDNILNSSNLALIFTKILAIGNALNAGTAMGEASGFSLESLLRTMSLKGGADKKMSVLDLSIKILQEKGFLDILDVVHDICEVEEACKLSPDNIFTEINLFNEEYAELSVELKNAQNYLTLYYQGALDAWLQSIAPGSTYVIKEEDLVTSPFGHGIVKEVRENGILRIRPSNWSIFNEVEHMMYIHKDLVSIRAPFVQGEEVMSRHGNGVIEEVRIYDSVAVIRPVTWGSSASSTPCIFEPIVSLRHQQKHQDDSNFMSESDMPKLTQKFIQKLKIFLRSSNKKRKEVNMLKDLMEDKIHELANYFGEKLHDDGISYVSDTFEILKSLRHSLVKSYKIVPKKIPPPPEPSSKKVKFSDTHMEAVAPLPLPLSSSEPIPFPVHTSRGSKVPSQSIIDIGACIMRPVLRGNIRRLPSFQYNRDYPFQRLLLTKKMLQFFRKFCQQNPVQRIVVAQH